MADAILFSRIKARLGGGVRLILSGAASLTSAEWLCSYSRRTIVGVDLDNEALTWGLENNVQKVGADAYSRICMFHGNVLHSLTSA